MTALRPTALRFLSPSRRLLSLEPNRSPNGENLSSPNTPITQSAPPYAASSVESHGDHATSAEGQDDLISKYSLRKLTSWTRNDMSKRTRRRLRRANEFFTATLQGGGGNQDRFITLRINDIRRDFNLGRFVSRDISNASFAGPVYDLSIEERTESGESAPVVERVRAYAKKLMVHPITEDPLSLGFVRAPTSESLAMEIPLAVINAEKCTVLKNGFMMRLTKCIKIRVHPMSAPPECAWLDLAGRTYGTVAAGEVIIPQSCDLLHDPDEKVMKIGKKV